MSAIEYRFLEPLDVLFLRGNKLFGDPGSFGESLVPPWPSVAAGAIRSRMLADEGVDLAAFARGDVLHPELGTPEAPGTFTVTAFHLARRRADGAVEALIQPPADLAISEDAEGALCVDALIPTALPHGEGLVCSSPLALLPVLAKAERRKTAYGYWLTQTGWKAYLAGRTPRAEDIVRSSELWLLDHRVGIGLDTASRRVADGRLFSMQAISMTKQGNRIGTDTRTGKPILADYDMGFLAAVIGATPPARGAVRLGGDGRAAAVQPAPTVLPQPDYNAIAKARRCRLVLTSPGVFSNGWLPNGITRTADGEHHFNLHGVKGHLVCAAVSRAEVVSGWDLANGIPKTAQRVVPAGGVYWLDGLDATEATLRKLVAQGLWSELCEDSARRAEGFNRFMLAAY